MDSYYKLHTTSYESHMVHNDVTRLKIIKIIKKISILRKVKHQASSPKENANLKPQNYIKIMYIDYLLHMNLIINAVKMELFIM